MYIYSLTKKNLSGIEDITFAMRRWQQWFNEYKHMNKNSNNS